MKTSEVEQVVFNDWTLQANLTKDEVLQGYTNLTVAINELGMNLNKSTCSEDTETMLVSFFEKLKTTVQLSAGLDFSRKLRQLGESEPHIRIIIEYICLADMYFAQGKVNKATTTTKEALSIVDKSTQPMTPDLRSASHVARCQLELKLAELYYFNNELRRASHYYRQNRIHYLLGNGHFQQANVFKTESEIWVQNQMNSYFEERNKTRHFTDEKKKLKHLHCDRCYNCESVAPFGEPFNKCRECNKPYCSRDCKVACWDGHRRMWSLLN
jgi:hypothetical protein